MSGSWSSGWVAGDIVTAAEFAKGAGAIADSTLGVAAVQFNFTGLLQTYAHLMVVLTARSDSAAGSVAINMRMNNDSGANYEHENVQGIDVVGSSGQAAAQTVAYIGDAAAATSGALRVGTLTLWIPQYAAATLNKGWHSIGGEMASSHAAWVRGGQWLSSAAINQLTIISGSGNFVAGSRCTIYGMGA